MFVTTETRAKFLTDMYFTNFPINSTKKNLKKKFEKRFVPDRDQTRDPSLKFQLPVSTPLDQTVKF